MELYITVRKDSAGYYVAEVPALPIKLSFGRTYGDALFNAKREIKSWLDTTATPSKIDSTILSHLLKRKGLSLEEFDN